MKLLDSNILIYAAESGQEALRERILAEPAGVSVVTMVEVLGYHLLTREEESDLRALLNQLTVFPADMMVAERAVTLRQQRKMSLGDAIIDSRMWSNGKPKNPKNTSSATIWIARRWVRNGALT